MKAPWGSNSHTLLDWTGLRCGVLCYGLGLTGLEIHAHQSSWGHRSSPPLPPCTDRHPCLWWQFGCHLHLQPDMKFCNPAILRRDWKHPVDPLSVFWTLHSSPTVVNWNIWKQFIYVIMLWRAKLCGGEKLHLSFPRSLWIFSFLISVFSLYCDTASPILTTHVQEMWKIVAEINWLIATG